MIRKHYSIDQLATETQRQAQGESAMMQSELKKLRASLANQGGSIRQPIIKTKRTWTKTTTESNGATLTLLAELGLSAIAGQGLESAGGTSLSSSLLDAVANGGMSRSQSLRQLAETLSDGLRLR
ncbi:MAG: hypothetical protein PHE27_08105 [Alphaproteobacteria bacterium]|nr:hypothetical protein [Alphaproteobacteria bacterium]